MRRLSDRAFKILAAEVKQCAHKDLAGDVGQVIVMQRLEKLCRQQGQPLTAEELRQVIDDQFPEFKPSVLKRAARANRPPGLGKKVLWGGVTLAGLVGGVWVANLPYPMIRWPVSKTVPILLIPSYITMDHNYRQAISAVEQADQLVNQATTQDDINLGEEKAQQAQMNLDRLPVWFLGYYPQRYCSFMSCSWKFTLDEYETARKKIGRMEARVFQEKNAFIRLNEAQSAVKTAKQSYQKSPEGGERQTAMKNWQGAIDLLQQIPPQTVAGKQAQTLLNTTQRDFQEQVGFSVQTQKGNTMIAAAQQFAILAARASQNPPHTAQEWQQVIELWEKAIARLEKVPEENPSYLEAQKKLAEYTQNLGTIQGRLRDEEEAVELLKEAKELITEWRELAQDSNPSISRLRRKLNQVINTLEDIEAGTTVTQEAQDLLRAARNTRGKL
jgi:tetratricopeptide (TPR) repeat protein